MSKGVGRICSFYPDPNMVKQCVVQPGAQRLTGVVTECVKAPPPKGWKRPDFTLTVRGKSGRTVTISLIENYAQFHATWPASSQSK